MKRKELLKRETSPDPRSLVPAADVRRLLKEKPAGVIGLTAPGMPMKSPGMQAEGLPPKNYDVIAIRKNGTTEVYTRY